MFFWSRYSKKIRKFHKKAPVLQSLFNKVTGLQTYNFIKKRHQRRCFPVKLVFSGDIERDQRHEMGQMKTRVMF